ncbi:hypothetical protein CISIN_1g0381261mg, partial [Citrus sinensis]
MAKSRTGSGYCNDRILSGCNKSGFRPDFNP